MTRWRSHKDDCRAGAGFCSESRRKGPDGIIAAFRAGRATMAGQQREVTFRFLTEPTDVNFGGKVHGGMVMKWIDQAGYAAAVGWSGRYCVTVAVGGV